MCQWVRTDILLGDVSAGLVPMAGAHAVWRFAIAESACLFPLIEGSHILALPISAGMIVIFDLHPVRYQEGANRHNLTVSGSTHLRSTSG